MVTVLFALILASIHKVLFFGALGGVLGAANVLTLVSFNNYRMTYLATFDGSATTLAYTQAQLAADCATLLAKYPSSPLPPILTQAFTVATQAAMRAATIDGGVAGVTIGCPKINIRPRTTAAPAAVANAVGFAADVTPDGVSTTKISLALQGPSTAGVAAYFDIVYPFPEIDG